MTIRVGRLVAVAILGIGLMLTGCAANYTDSTEPRDPFEAANRDIDALNNHVDRNILAPVAHAYIDTVPSGMRQGVSNFFDNLGEPNNFLNDLLQGKLGDALVDAGRFFINSTIGLAGLFDPASAMGMERNDEDFGQTLGVWGADAGAYLVLPLLGPSSTRDIFRYPVAIATDPLTYVDLGWYAVPLKAIEVLDTRARIDSAIRLRDESAVEPYIFTREAYSQRRLDQVYDGNPPDDFFDSLEKSSSNWQLPTDLMATAAN